MPYPYISNEDVRLRLGAPKYHRLFDEDGDGLADDVNSSGDTSNTVERIRRDASAKVAGYLRGIYDLDAVATDTPEEVKRLALDVFVAIAAQRHPEVMRVEWKDLLDAVERDLRNLREGKTRLDVMGSPEPARNNGAEVLSGNPRKPDVKPPWGGNFGDF